MPSEMGQAAALRPALLFLHRNSIRKRSGERAKGGPRPREHHRTRRAAMVIEGPAFFPAEGDGSSAPEPTSGLLGYVFLKIRLPVPGSPTASSPVTAPASRLLW